MTGDSIAGGADTDTLVFTSAVSLTGGFTLASVEQLDMGGFALNVNTTAAVNLSTLTKVGISGSIIGNAAINTITGTASADTIAGGDGNDILVGSGGNDIIIGGLGNDSLTADAGHEHSCSTRR